MEMDQEPPKDTSFDADDFLAFSQDESDRIDDEIMSMNKDIIAIEGAVIDALEQAGLSVDRIRLAQSRLAADLPLQYCIQEMVLLRNELDAVEDMIGVADALHAAIMLSCAIQKIASLKLISDMANAGDQLEYKQQQQMEIYANANLSPEEKELLLTAIGQLYPGAEALDPASPQTLLEVENYVANRKTEDEIKEKASSLREMAYDELYCAMAEHGLGQHDRFTFVANAIVTSLTKLCVLKAGNYDDEVVESMTANVNSVLWTVRQDVRFMGWPESQLGSVLEQIHSRLRMSESE